MEAVGTGEISNKLRFEDGPTMVRVVKMTHQIDWRFKANQWDASPFLDRLFLPIFRSTICSNFTEKQSLAVKDIF